jgi:hypothetical protein
MPLLIEAIRTELRKLDRPAGETDLRWQPRRPREAAGA